MSEHLRIILITGILEAESKTRRNDRANYNKNKMWYKMEIPRPFSKKSQLRVSLD